MTPVTRCVSQVSISTLVPIPGGILNVQKEDVGRSSAQEEQRGIKLAKDVKEGMSKNKGKYNAIYIQLHLLFLLNMPNEDPLAITYISTNTS